MKKLGIISLLILAAAFPASAESPHVFGVKGGLNLFNVYGGDVEEATYRTGFAIGAAYSYSFNRVFALQPELYYSVKGTKNEEDDEIKLKEGYIDVPVLFRVSFPVKSSSWSPGIYAGPYLALLMNADVAGEDVKDLYNSVDYGLVVGGTIDFKLSGGDQVLGFDFRYSVGFASIDELQIAEIYNNGFQFLLGYGFGL
jgi:hypothetical protein